MLQSVRVYEGPGSLINYEFSQIISSNSSKFDDITRFCFVNFTEDETRLAINRSGPAYTIFGPLAAMIAGYANFVQKF